MRGERTREKTDERTVKMFREGGFTLVSAVVDGAEESPSPRLFTCDKPARRSASATRIKDTGDHELPGQAAAAIPNIWLPDEPVWERERCRGGGPRPSCREETLLKETEVKHHSSYICCALLKVHATDSGSP